MIALEVDKGVALKNILFATDFSRGSNVALPYAVSLARQHGAMLHAAHVMSSEPHLFVAPESWAAFMRAEEDRARAEVVRLAKKVQGVPHSVLARAGDAWSVLARFIEERDIDLLVVGTHGKSGLPELSMGSTAERRLRRAPCPARSLCRHDCHGGRRVVGKIGTAHLAGTVQKVAARANCPVLTVHGDAPADWQQRLLHGNRARASESRLAFGAFLNCSATQPAAYCG